MQNNEIIAHIRGTKKGLEKFLEYSKHLPLGKNSECVQKTKHQLELCDDFLKIFENGKSKGNTIGTNNAAIVNA